MDQILIYMDVQHLLVSLSICRLVVRTMGNDQKESIMNNRRLQDYIVYNIYMFLCFLVTVCYVICPATVLPSESNMLLVFQTQNQRNLKGNGSCDQSGRTICCKRSFGW